VSGILRRVRIDGVISLSCTNLASSEEINSDPPENTPPKSDFSAFVPEFKARGDAKGVKMRQDVFSLTEGEAVIRWPTPLSADSIADLDEWLDLVKRKIKRSASETKTEPAQE